MNEQFCNCEEPVFGEEWVAVGLAGNIMDYQVCEHCGKPIMGTQTTHVEDEE